MPSPRSLDRDAVDARNYAPDYFDRADVRWMVQANPALHLTRVFMLSHTVIASYAHTRKP